MRTVQQKPQCLSLCVCVNTFLCLHFLWHYGIFKSGLDGTDLPIWLQLNLVLWTLWGNTECTFIKCCIWTCAIHCCKLECIRVNRLGHDREVQSKIQRHALMALIWHSQTPTDVHVCVCVLVANAQSVQSDTRMRTFKMSFAMQSSVLCAVLCGSRSTCSMQKHLKWSLWSAASAFSAYLCIWIEHSRTFRMRSQPSLNHFRAFRDYVEKLSLFVFVIGHKCCRLVIRSNGEKCGLTLCFGKFPPLKCCNFIVFLIIGFLNWMDAIQASTQIVLCSAIVCVCVRICSTLAKEIQINGVRRTHTRTPNYT